MGFKTNKGLWNSVNNYQYYRMGSSEQEYQANEFAASLLMPEKMYKEYLNQYATRNKINISLLADKFQVSLEAASNRGKFLGLLKW